jgi:phosphoglycerol transferase MdoB-like AlkP superfamily enzyme
LGNLREVWASIYNQPLFFILLAFILLFGILIISLNIIVIGKESFQPVNKIFSSFFILIFTTATLIIPIRGGLQLAPLNQSSVYFSENIFLNQASLNAPWNFIFSIINKSKFSKNPYDYLDSKSAKSIVDSLYQTNGENFTLVNIKSDTLPNIIFIIWESLTSKVINRKVGDIYVTPGLNNLINEGIYFSNMYASGDRTDKGLVALLSGFPAQAVTSIIKEPSKSEKLPSLSEVLTGFGYRPAFYYGGELEFANIKSYLINGGYLDLVSINDFKKEDRNSKWGAHDGVVMKRLLKDISTKTTPFFYTWLTLSSHEPFETPTPTVIEGNTEELQFYNSLQYTDSVVYQFVKQCQAKDWWNNTLIIICADHGHRLPQTGKKADDFKIPALLLGGLVKNKQVVIDEICSQTDLAPTLVKTFDINNNLFKWGRNIADPTSVPLAYFSFNDGFGFVQNKKYFIFDNVGKKVIEQEGNIDASDLKAGKAIQQLSFQEYLDK